MAKKRVVKISEAQYKRILDEAINVAADVKGSNGDVAQAVTKASDNAVAHGVRPSDVNVQVSGSDIHESKSPKDILKERMNKLNENSTVYSRNSFLKKIGF